MHILVQHKVAQAKQIGKQIFALVPLPYVVQFATAGTATQWHDRFHADRRMGAGIRAGAGSAIARHHHVRPTSTLLIRQIQPDRLHLLAGWSWGDVHVRHRLIMPGTTVQRAVTRTDGDETDRQSGRKKREQKQSKT